MTDLPVVTPRTPDGEPLTIENVVERFETIEEFEAAYETIADMEEGRRRDAN